jgi:hypothetical protein
MNRELIDWKVRPIRRKLALPGTASSSNGRSFKIMLSNISYEGCHLLAEYDLMVGEVIEVEVPGMGRMQAQVRWASEDQAGVRFLLGSSITEARRARIGV